MSQLILLRLYLQLPGTVPPVESSFLELQEQSVLPEADISLLQLWVGGEEDTMDQDTEELEESHTVPEMFILIPEEQWEDTILQLDMQPTSVEVEVEVGLKDMSAMLHIADQPELVHMEELVEVEVELIHPTAAIMVTEVEVEEVEAWVDQELVEEVVMPQELLEIVVEHQALEEPVHIREAMVTEVEVEVEAS
jgi:hypothetical protein